MRNRLLLYCDVTHSSFTLAREGDEKRQSFTDLQDALDYATEIVSEETQLRVFNELGKLIIESTVAPHAQSRMVCHGD